MRVAFMNVDMVVTREYNGIQLRELDSSYFNLGYYDVIKHSDFFVIFKGEECVIVKDRNELVNGSIGLLNVWDTVDILSVVGRL